MAQKQMGLLKCEVCGAGIPYVIGAETVTCGFCGSVYELSEQKRKGRWVLDSRTVIGPKGKQTTWVIDERTEFTTRLLVVVRYAYASITDHIAPGEAAEGETITVGGEITNIGEARGGCRMVMHWSDHHLGWGEVGTIIIDYNETLAVGAYFKRTTTMTMPAHDLYTYIDAYHWE